MNLTPKNEILDKWAMKVQVSKEMYKKNAQVYCIIHCGKKEVKLEEEMLIITLFAFSY